MDISALLDQLSAAVQGKNWLLVVVLVIALLAAGAVPLLRLLKKPEAAKVVETVGDVAETVVKVLPKAEAPKDAGGIAAVVPVEEKKGPNP